MNRPSAGFCIAQPWQRQILSFALELCCAWLKGGQPAPVASSLLLGSPAAFARALRCLDMPVGSRHWLKSTGLHPIPVLDLVCSRCAPGSLQHPPLVRPWLCW